MNKAVIANKAGGPEVLSFSNVDLKELKNDEVRIKQKAIGVNFIDTYHRTGLYPGMNYPEVIGVEAAGVIEETGKDVTKYKIGDRVCYPLAKGAYTQLRNIHENLLVKIPNDVTEEIAAASITKGITVHHLFNVVSNPKEGDWVLFHAAAGGVGLIACQWAKQAGIKLIGTVSSKEKAELAKNYGAEETVIYTEEDFVEKVNNFTNGKGVVAAYDGIGGENPIYSAKTLSKFGTLCTFGAASGPSKLTIDHLQPSIKYTKGSIATLVPEIDMFDVASKEFFKLLKEDKIKINIGNEFSLEDAAEAHILLENRKTTGSIILKT